MVLACVILLACVMVLARVMVVACVMALTRVIVFARVMVLTHDGWGHGLVSDDIVSDNSKFTMIFL